MVARGIGGANVKMTKFAYAMLAILVATVPAFAAIPNCSGTGNWPASMAFVAMKNAKLVTNDQIDFSRTKVRRLTSEQVKKGLWRQVHLVQYYRKDGTVLEAITVSDASLDECSMGDVQTFVVSEKLLPGGQKSN
jgi:hypothetical protein